MTYSEWAQRHPQAAADFQAMLTEQPASEAYGKTEAWAQQQDRMRLARTGGAGWRNNVGATQSKCHEHRCGGKIVCGRCGTPPQQVRYGLSNDSTKLNKEVKSSDIIGIIPRLITPAMVGQIIGQFAAIESKRPGWHYTGTQHEQAQAAFHMLIVSKGGFATFSTGELEL